MCSVYRRPDDPVQVVLEPVVHLAPLVHGALGHARAPSEADNEAAQVHRCAWSEMVPWGPPPAGAAAAMRAAVGIGHVVGGVGGGEAASDCCFLALAGPALLIVIAHAPSAPTPDAQWQTAIRLHPPPSPASC